ncbi:fibronectin type III domain-containing protein [Levilactobacillus yiduensis]|uniref:fibronectin type III domain-containing protein n=1 Tax=Levilactobacillus yiduensis TaxID=2953880 RepID=UPI0021589056|nr:fibronectin type III domain-containing protein [Levilactobacillus yiduensis]
MADSSRTIMTDAGFALETRVRADETKMQFTRAAISTDDHFSDTDDVLAKLTELSNIQQDGKVTAVQVINTTTVYVQVDVNQAESKADYQMRSAALYAKDDDGTEVLYGVTVLQDPVFVHKDADGSYLGFGINTTVGRASNVVVVVDPTNMVTQQVFEGTMKNYYTKAEVDAKFVTDDDFASKLPKNIATTDAANTFAKSQTLAGGATDSKGNAYATMKDVATGLNNGLSTKVTDNKNGTITANSLTYDLSKSGLTSLQLVNSGSFNDLPLGTVFAGTSIADGPDKTHTFTATTFYFSGWSGRKAQIAIADSVNLMYFRVYMGINWTDWTLLSDDSKVVHATDMRKPASDVAGIEEVNAKQDKIGYTPADDSKVLHSTVTELNSTDMNTVQTAGFYQLISGTNGMPNADKFTLYQVIPLTDYYANGVQLAYGTNNAISGMRSWNSYNSFTSWVQFADDSKVVHNTGTEEISGQKTFDTAPIDKTTGNPYITAKTPGIPKLAVKYNATSKAFDYTLTVPEKDGLSDIIQYNLLWKDHSVDDWTTVIVKPDALTGQLTGVYITKTYDFKAAAQNAVGPSGFTDVITLPAASVPGIPSLTAEYNAGKKGFDYTVTAPESDGGSEITGYSLEYQKQGGTEWTKVALNSDSLTGTVTDGIEAGSDYLLRVNAENAVGSSDYFTVSYPLPTVDGNIYGVSWDGSSSGALQRTDAAVGLKAGINGAQNDFDTVGPWAKMDKTITDDKGNSFVRIPKLYIKKTQTDKLATWQVSLSKIDDTWYLPKCFWDFTSNKELDYVDVGRYQGTVTGGLLQSKSGVAPTNSLEITAFRSDAKANGDGYQLLDIHVIDVWQVLFIIEFATLSSQSIMPGNLDNGANGSAKTNGTGSNHAGSSGYATSTGPMDYRGIENMYGNLYQFVDGINITNQKPWVCDDPAKYQSDLFAAPYQPLGYALPASGFITKMGYDPDHPFAQFATVANGTLSTYYTDYQFTTTGNMVAYYGDYWGSSVGYGGAFCWGFDYASSGTGVYHGSRLIRRALV